jgi:hypothetical protein
MIPSFLKRKYFDSKLRATTQSNVQSDHDEVSFTLVKKNGVEDFRGAKKLKTIL